jgi:uncharacterized phiE125 gp8 family phage protein
MTLAALGHYACVEIPSTSSPEELVPVQELKEFLRLDDATEENLLKGLGVAARQTLERQSRYVGLRRRYRLSLDDTPCERVVALPRVPLVSVESVTAYDRSHAPTVLSSSDYYVDTASEPGRLVLNDDASWPSGLRDIGGLEIAFTAGYSTGREGVPPAMAIAVKQFVAVLYEHRGEAAGADEPLPPIVRTLMGPHWLPDAG